MKGRRPAVRRLLGVISPVARALGRSMMGRVVRRRRRECPT